LASAVLTNTDPRYQALRSCATIFYERVR